MIRRLELLAACALSLLALAPTPAAAQAAPVTLERLAQERPTLRREAIVEGDVVTLGDLVANAGQHAGMPLFGAPALGRSGIIGAARVVTAAREAGLAGFSAGGLDHVVVTRPGRAASHEEVQTLLARALAERTERPARDVEARLDGAAPTLALALREPAGLTVADLRVERAAGRFTATLEAPGGQRAAVSGRLVETILVPVLSREMARGDTLRAGDAVMERRERAFLPADALVDGSALDGKAARKALRAGVPLRESDLLRPVVVERASMVTIAYEVPGITLSLKGKAMEAGALGDAVSVQNLTSKRMIQAVVTGPGRVRVGDAPLVGKVAAATAATAALQP